jgi:hypothetical protein
MQPIKYRWSDRCKCLSSRWRLPSFTPQPPQGTSTNSLSLFSPSHSFVILSAVRFSGNLRSGTSFINNLKTPIVCAPWSGSRIAFSCTLFTVPELFHTGRTSLVFTIFYCFGTSELTGMRSKGAYTSIERIVDGKPTFSSLFDAISCLSGRPGTAMCVYGLMSHSMTVLG